MFLSQHRVSLGDFTVCTWQGMLKSPLGLSPVFALGFLLSTRFILEVSAPSAAPREAWRQTCFGLRIRAGSRTYLGSPSAWTGRGRSSQLLFASLWGEGALEQQALRMSFLPEDFSSVHQSYVEQNLLPVKHKRAQCTEQQWERHGSASSGWALVNMPHVWLSMLLACPGATLSFVSTERTLVLSFHWQCSQKTHEQKKQNKPTLPLLRLYYRKGWP